MMGIRIPFPMHQRWLPENYNPSGSIPNKIYDLRYYISRDGCVDSVVFPDGVRKKLDESLLGAILGVDFYPAMQDGDSIPFILPARLDFSRRGSTGRVNLYFPYNRHFNYRNNEMLDQTLALNGYTPAEITWVPRYYCMSDEEVPENTVPFAIFKITLDKGGLLQDIKTVATNNQSCAKIVSSVMLYSSYRPAQFREKPIDSDFYVTVRNFRQIGNPTAEWPPQNPEKAGYLYNALRIESNPYLDSNVVYPIPTNLTGNTFYNRDTVRIIDSIAVPVLINPSGRAVVSGGVQGLSAGRENAVRDIVSKLQFIPLQDISGRKLAFNGTLALFFNFSKKIRIHLNWYSEAIQDGPVNVMPDKDLGAESGEP